MEADGEEIFSKKRPVVAPGEMETISLNATHLDKIKKASKVVVSLKEA